MEWYTPFSTDNTKVTPSAEFGPELSGAAPRDSLSLLRNSASSLTDITTTMCIITRFTQHLHVHTVNVYELITCHCQDTTPNTIKCVRWVGTSAHSGACSSSNGYMQHVTTLNVVSVPLHIIMTRMRHIVHVVHSKTHLLPVLCGSTGTVAWCFLHHCVAGPGARYHGCYVACTSFMI